MLFFLFAALLVLLVAAVLLLSWMRSRPVGEVNQAERERVNVLVARERLAEIERFGPSGDDRQVIEQEIATELATDTRAGAESGLERDDGTTGPWLALVCVMFLFVGSGLVYLLIGNPATLAGVQVASQASEGSVEGSLTLDQIVERLGERLKANPDDAEGWSMLARSFAAMGRYGEAVPALRQLRRLSNNDADSTAQLADAVAMSQGGRIDGEASTLLDEALAANPQLPRGLWLAATRARQQGDPEQALALFAQLEPLLQGDQESLKQIQEVVRDTRAEAGLPAAESSAASGETGSDVVSPGFAINVSLDPSLVEGLSGDEIVFIYARATEGPPMPLAAKKLSLAALPTTVRLSVADAMMPQMSLENFEEVVVGARVSTTGQPIPASGDRQGESATIRWREIGDLDIVIDRVLP